MAPHSSTLAWKIPWAEEPCRLQSMGSLRVGHDWATTFTFQFHALEKEMATHSSVLAWRIPGMGKPGGLPSTGSHWVGHDWSDLTAAVATILSCFFFFLTWTIFKVLIEFVTMLFLFYVLVCWLQGTWHLSSLTRVQICTHAMESRILTPGPPGKSHIYNTSTSSSI